MLRMIASDAGDRLGTADCIRRPAVYISERLPLPLPALTASVVNAQKSPAVRQPFAAYGNKLRGLRHTHLSGNTALSRSLDLIGDPLPQNRDGIRHYASPLLGRECVRSS